MKNMSKYLFAAVLTACTLHPGLAADDPFSNDTQPKTYVSPDGTEYLEGYQPPDAVLQTKPAPPLKGPPSTKPIPFRAKAEVRPAYSTGWDVSVAGGVDAFQSNTLTDHLEFTEPVFGQPQNGDAKFKEKSSAGFFVGGSVAYTWAGFDGKADLSGGHFVLLPSVQLDGFYLSRTSTSNGPTYTPSQTGYPAGDNVYTSQTADLSAYGITVDFVLRAQAGAFRPYLGIGAGGAVAKARHLSVDINAPGLYDLGGNGNYSSTVPVLTAMIGTDLFLSPHLSLFGEYRFIDLWSVKFSDGTDYAKGNFGENVFDAGLRWHF